MGTWLPYCCPDQQAIWPVFMKKKWGIPYVTMPALTPRLGPFPSVSVPPNAPPNLGHYALFHLEKTAESIGYFVKNGFTTQDRYHYKIPPHLQLSQITAALNTLSKRQIKKGDQALHLLQTGDWNDLYRLMHQRLSRKGVGSSVSPHQLEQICQQVTLHNSGGIWVALDEQNRIHAAILLVWDHLGIYYLAGGLDESIKQMGGSRWLLWQGIQLAHESGRFFDFGGGMNPSVGSVYAAMGGQKNPYLRAVKYRFPVLSPLLQLAKSIYAPNDQLHH